MELLNPANNQFAEIIKDLQQRLNKLETTTQPGFIDWLTLNPASTEYVSNNVIRILDSSMLAILSESDPVRINQGGLKYFQAFTINRTTGDVTLIAGSDYTFTSASYTAVAVSKIERPTGFPSSWNFTPTVTNYNDSASPSVTSTNSSKFVYSHPFVRVFNGIVDVQFAVATDGVTLTLPVNSGGLNNKFESGSLSEPFYQGSPSTTINNTAEATFGDLSKVRLRQVPISSSTFQTYTYAYKYIIT